MPEGSTGAFPQAELQGPIYCWVAGKAPKTDHWNHKSNLLTLQQIQEGKKPSWATGYGMVSGRYSGFLCVDVDTKPERPEMPNTTFRGLAKRDLAHLPPTATVISGKPNRWRAYFRVPSEWWPELSGYSLNRGDLELRWEDGDPENPAAKQSVIAGPHPDGGDLHFRWREGNRPEDVGIADCPVWLLKGMILDHQREQINAEIALEAKQTRSADGELTPIEKLTPKEHKTLLRLMSEKWPYRGGLAGTRFQCSYEADSFNGLLGALFNLFGADTAYEWLHDTEWFKNNENWGAGSDFTKAVNSVGKSNTQVEAGWGTLMYLATRTECDGVQFKEPAFRWPKELMKPGDIDVNNLTTSTRKLREQLEKGLEYIYKLDDPADREIGFYNLREEAGIKNEKMWNTVIWSLEQQEKEPEKEARTWNEVVSAAKKITPAIDKFLPFGAVTMLGADPGTGKTTFLYRVAEAAAYGKKFMGQLECVKGNVLIIQKDESDSNLAQKDSRMCIDDPDGFIKVRFEFSPTQVRDIAAWIDQVKAKYVVMDSFASLFAGGADLVDANAGYYLYELNKIASKKNVAILLTHHLVKMKDRKQRTDVYLSDLYGSQFIAAGTSDAWGLHMDGNEPEGPDQAVVLKSLKARTGIAEAGDSYVMERDADDLSLNIKTWNGMENGIGGLKAKEQKVLAALRRVAVGEENAVVVGDQTTHGTLACETSMDKRALNKALDALKNRPEANLRSRTMPASGRGKRAKGYWVEK